MFDTATNIHVLRLKALLEDTRQKCKVYDEPLQIELWVGAKPFMKLSKADLAADFISAIDLKAFEEALEPDSTLMVEVSTRTAEKAEGENLCR